MIVKVDHQLWLFDQILAKLMTLLLTPNVLDVNALSYNLLGYSLKRWDFY